MSFLFLQGEKGGRKRLQGIYQVSGIARYFTYFVFLTFYLYWGKGS